MLTREQRHLMRRFRGGRLAGAAPAPAPAPARGLAGGATATRPGWGTGARGRWAVEKQFCYRAGRAWKLLRAKRGAEGPSPSSPEAQPEAQPEPAFGCSDDENKTVLLLDLIKPEKIKMEKALRMPGKLRGVRFHPTDGKWHSRITKKKIHLGCFHDMEAAARTYDRAAIANLGRDLALTNFDINEYAAEFDKLEELGVIKYAKLLERERRQIDAVQAAEQVQLKYLRAEENPDLLRSRKEVAVQVGQVGPSNKRARDPEDGPGGKRQKKILLERIDELRGKTKEIDELQGTLRGKLQQAEAESVGKTKEIDELRGKLQQAEAESVGKTKEIDELRDKLQQAEAEAVLQEAKAINELQQVLREAKWKNSGLEGRIRDVLAENGDLRRELAEQKKQNAFLLAHIQDIRKILV